ncbi:hypothetical protein N7499_009427 [Penicillium canescens]|uniref:Uncharacterized protein n=1 Tax=Penicillium canescens TaxID=5083 RepID=A0AAD6NEQ0_PENCN|nr:uncharacterized protein N7446_008551 [Penicillium canescens]KAJ6019607.1 hypothetical protein N7522_001674 [Penicillium canescens]KAJ6033158.1 hypothetical protein N7444_010929 [Penicillium canescens]KAJ6057654.1 hypothetical protein N7460_000928 [Penicillium canescens]KAJ6058968.1 hypothetical protein N7446_008551 [Penicillium canescens]KAJ6071413.1 hypothetical protein N7499_009427 [Penicillium canescens]
MISDHLNQGDASIHEEDTELGPEIMKMELAWLDVMCEVLNRLQSLMLSQLEGKEEENMALREQIDFLKGLLEECHEQEKAGHLIVFEGF